MKLYIASLLILCCLSCAEPMAVTSSNGSNGNYSNGSTTTSATDKTSTLSKDNSANTVIPKDNHIHNATNRKVTQTN